MNTRIAAAVASLFVASLGTAAFAQQVPPQQQMPKQPSPPAQQQMPPQQSPPAQQMPPSQPQAAAAAPASSAKVTRQVKQALTKDGVTATKVEVAFDNGAVTLTGSVFSKEDIAKARVAAMKVPGVTAVDVSGLHSRKG